MRTYRRLFSLLLPLLIGLAIPASAQLDGSRSRASLRGITGFYLIVDIERSGSVPDDEGLQITAQVTARLKAASLPLLQAASPDEERLPYLYVHVNAVDADTGLVPFAVDIAFHQAVTLARDPASPTIGSTWTSGLVGYTYTNQLAFLAEATLTLIDEFVEDFRSVNASMR